MTRETKLGIAFIGILLTVFTGLLVKKLTRPKAANSGAAQTNEVAGAPRTLPTMVQPRSESSKPPVLADLDKNSYGQSNASQSSLPNSAQANSSQWGSMGQSSLNQNADPYESSLKVKQNSLADTAPAVLSAPKPITDIDRYDSPREPLAAQANNAGDRYASQSLEPSSSAQLHSSGYYGSPAEPERSTATAAQSSATQSPAALQPLEAKATADSSYQSPVNARVANDYRNYPNTPAAQTTRAQTSAGGYWEQSKLTGTPTAPPSYTSPAATTANDYAQRQQHQPASVIGNSTAWSNTTVPAASQNYSAATPAALSTAILPQPASANGNLREGNQYEVQPGDSFWTISEKAYGTGAYFKALYEHNRKRYKNREELTVGQVLSLPDEAVLRRAYPDLSPKPRTAVAPAQQRLVSASTRLRGPGRIYTVTEGDTLFEIARHELGKPARWGEIYELNRELLGKDFDYLRPGTELILPVSSGNNTPATATRPADSLYPR